MLNEGNIAKNHINRSYLKKIIYQMFWRYKMSPELDKKAWTGSSDAEFSFKAFP